MIHMAGSSQRWMG